MGRTKLFITVLGIAAIAVGCQEFPCADPIEVSVDPIPFDVDSVRLTYFTDAGAETTRDLRDIPSRARPAVLVQTGEELPIGVVLMADFSDGPNDQARLTTHGIAATRAHTSRTGGWRADHVWQRAQVLAEDRAPTDDESIDELEDTLEGSLKDSLRELDRKRRKRWSTALEPSPLDVGLIKPAPTTWVFDRESCLDREAPREARRFDIDALEEAQQILRMLGERSGIKPTVPARWSPTLPR